MERNEKTIREKTLTHFTKIDSGIKELNLVLSSNIFTHHLNRWTSLILEFLLYILFLVALVCSSGITGREYVIFGFISLPSPIIALLLRRNRRRNVLIHKAANELQKLKQDFEAAVKDLEL